MPSISLGINDKELAAIKMILSPQQYKQANYQATKRATRRGRVMMGDTVRSRLTIRKKFIDAPNSKDAAIKDRFDRTTQTGKITTTRIGLPLTEFEHTDTKTSGVTIRIDTAQAALQIRHGFRARVKSKSQNASGIAGHVGIFSRKKIDKIAPQWWESMYPGITSNPAKQASYKADGYGPGTSGLTRSGLRNSQLKRFTSKGIAWRLPIEERFGPAVYDLVSRDEVLRPTMAKLFELYRDEWGNQISRFTGGRIKTLSALPIESGDTDN